MNARDDGVAGAEAAITESTMQCGRCGGTKLIQARLEQGMTFFVNDEAHHSICKIPMKANLCQECGYTEFWVIEPSRALPCDDDERTIQEEDF